MIGEWKIYTVYIGLSDIMYQKEEDGLPTDPEVYYQRVKGYLSQYDPYFGKLYVNLVGFSEHLSDYQQNVLDDPDCSVKIQLWLSTWDGELSDPATWSERAKAYNVKLMQIATELDDPANQQVYRFQPFLRDWIPNKEDLEGYSCFHPNKNMINDMAYALFRNMQEDVAPIYKTGLRQQ